MHSSLSRASSSDLPLSASKEEDAVDPELGSSSVSASQPTSTRPPVVDRIVSEGQQTMLVKTLDMLDRAHVRADAEVDRANAANERFHVASAHAASKELEVYKLQQTIEQLKRELETGSSDSKHEPARKRTRTENGASITEEAPPAQPQEQVGAEQAAKIAELEAKTAALREAEVSARRESEEALAAKNLKIAELEVASNKAERETKRAAEVAKKTIDGGLVKIAQLTQKVEDLETVEKQALVARKKVQEKEDEISNLKERLTAFEGQQRPAQGPCSDAAHLAAAASIERVEQVVRRLQKEHEDIGKVRATLMEWMPSIETIRNLVDKCTAGKPSKDAATLHRWVRSQAETMENLCGELMWAQSANDAADAEVANAA